MQKILFGDIDGVLNTSLWFGPKDKNAPKDKWGYAFNPSSVANLKRIVDKTGADIVLTSSWKCIGLTELRKMWKSRNLPGNIIDVTPTRYSDEELWTIDIDDVELENSRGYEIKEWLLRHGKQVGTYAIIDDMYEMLSEQQSRLVLTNSEKGLTADDADRVILLLNS